MSSPSAEPLQHPYLALMGLLFVPPGLLAVALSGCDSPISAVGWLPHLSASVLR